MNLSLSNITKLLLCGLLSGALGMSLFAQEEVEEEVYELSPFVVEEDDNIGYLAQSSLAGTRLKTDLRDLGSAITVVTQELLDDVGATDAETILQYVSNTEVGGAQGNFAGFGDSATFQRADTSGIRTEPQSNQRVRGLSRAALTRNYFLTNIPFDGYNIKRTTVNRGPNSLLFGIGDPGGVINNDISQARVGRSFGTVSLRLGERSSHRGTFDFNKEVVKGRLAVRFMGLDEDTQYQQRPAYQKDKRFTVAGTAVLLKNKKGRFWGSLTLRGSYESGELYGTPPDVIPPANNMIEWFEAPDPALQEITGTTFPAWVTDGSFVPKFTLDNQAIDYNRNTAPGSVVEPWFPQLALIYNQPGAQIPTIGLSDPSIQGTQGRLLFNTAKTGPNKGRKRMNLFRTRSFIGGDYTPGFTVPTINDPNVWDNENHLLAGRLQEVNRDFDATNIVLEQLFLGGDAGIEFAYDQQTYENDSIFPFGTGNQGGGTAAMDVGIDIARFLGNGEPNPNLGRPFVATRQYYRPDRTTERETARVTGFYNLDFTENEGLLGWFGRHVFSGMYNEETIDTYSLTYGHAWTGVNVDIATTIPGGLNAGGRPIMQAVYLGPSVLDADSWHDVRLEGVSVPIPQDGEVYSLMYYDRSGDAIVKTDDFRVTKYINGGNISQKNLESKIFGWQSFFFDGHLVGLMGWRKDSIDIFGRAANGRLPSGEYDVENNLILTEDSIFDYSGDTFTWSLVGHVPYKLPGETTLSLHYGESENFDPTGIRRDSYNNVLSPPNGKTTEYGFTLTMLENRLSARFNWFETAINNASAGLGSAVTTAVNTPARWWSGWRGQWESGVPIEESLELAGAPAGYWSSYEEAFEDIISSLVPPELQAVRNFRLNGTDIESDGIPGETATTDFVAEGFEFELAGNINPSWRVFMNISKQETIQNNTAPALREIVANFNELLAASPIANFKDTPVEGIDFTFQSRFDLRATAPLASALAKDGTVSQELRKWRANLVTTYNFKDGLLKGAFAGLGIRWQDKIATGYPLVVDEFGNLVPDVTRPFMDAEQFNGDLWIGYTKKLTDKLTWKIQINGRNVFGDSDPITVTTNPDGNVAVIRNSLPKEFFITNTFSF